MAIGDSIMDPDGHVSYERDMLDRVERLENALKLIQKIGERYSGFGISCARIADNALNNTPLSEQTKKTIQLVQPVGGE